MGDFDLVAALILVGHIVIAVVAAIVNSAKRKPASAIARVMAVVFIPLTGGLFFGWWDQDGCPSTDGTSNASHRSHRGQDRGRAGQKVSLRDDWPPCLASVGPADRTRARFQ